MKAIIKTGFVIEVENEEEAEKIASRMNESVRQTFEMESNFLGVDVEELEEEGIIQLLEPSVDIIL
jgi:uncharacterized ferredoxin-like protein